MRAIALTLFSFFALLLIGCPTDGSGNPIFQNGEEVPDRDPDETWSADLSSGVEIDLDWATGGMGCWPGTENVNFDGSHVHDERSQAEDTDAWVRAVPETGVDISLYLIKAGTQSTDYPPDLNSSVSCDTSYDRENDGNPGVSEAAKALGGNNPYRLVIGVAGANGTTDGSFEVQLWLGE